MTFEFKPAVRQNIPLLIGIAGPTGSGKTFSAMRLAKGIAGDARFCVIDTENGRALHYADEFDFDHGLLTAPFTPERYAEAVEAADAAGYPVIVVDSASHEHAGEGGLLDMQEDVLQKRAGDDYKRRELLSMASWVEPKKRHKRFVAKLGQLNAHLILCFRAEEKVEMAKEGGKTVIRPKRTLAGHVGWIPIAEKNLPFELTTSLVVTPDAPGVPHPIKLEQQHRLVLPLDQPLSEETGAALASWATGAQSEQDQRAEQLTADLLDCADELGKRDEVTAAIQKHRKRNPAQHAQWLQAQLAHAQEAVAALEPAEVQWGAEAVS
jgi:hypothetical protein